MKKSDVLIIIPAYNEEENIKKVVDNLSLNYSEYDYLVINDGSTDNTAKICLENNFNFLDLPVNLGIGGCIQSGYRYALRNGYEIAIQHDGDGQHDPEYFKPVIHAMKEQNADIAIGSRFINKEGFQSTGMRRLGINWLSKLIKICCGADIKDVTSGFRAVNRKFIEIYANEYAQDYPEPEAIVAAALNDGKIIEVPVLMKEREGGESSIRSFKAIEYMIKVSLSILLYRFTFDKRRKKK